MRTRLFVLALLFLHASQPSPSSALLTGGSGEVHYGDKTPGTVNPAPNKGGGGTKTRVTTPAPVVPADCLQWSAAEARCLAGPGWVATPRPRALPTDAPPAAPAGPPAEVLAAIEFFRTHHLPVPQPVMSTPEAITGAEHSIDLGMPATEQFVDPDTPFGELRLNATGRFTVNWGDGTTDTYRTTGAPWPQSDLTHTWTKRGTYEITVTADWTVDWSYAGQTGTLTGLRTTNTIEDFRAIELQAIIVAN